MKNGLRVCDSDTHVNPMTARENATLAATVAREQLGDKAVQRTNKRGAMG